MKKAQERLETLHVEGDVEIEIITTALADAKFFKGLGGEYLKAHFGTKENAEAVLEKLNACVTQAEIDEVVNSVGRGWAEAIAKGINKKILSGDSVNTREELNELYPARMVRYALRSTQTTEETLKDVVADVAQKALAEAEDIETALKLFEL